MCRSVPRRIIGNLSPHTRTRELAVPPPSTTCTPHRPSVCPIAEHRTSPSDPPPGHPLLLGQGGLVAAKERLRAEVAKCIEAPQLAPTARADTDLGSHLWAEMSHDPSIDVLHALPGDEH